MKRSYNLDLLRVLLSICVISTHALRYFGIENDSLNVFVRVFLLQADGLFYMLSGYFNLEKEFNNSDDIKKYYKNKAIYVLLPFVAFLLVLTIWNYLHENPGFDVVDFLKTFYESFMSTASGGHMWFLYPLFGLLISTPFLSKMLHNMDEKELKILWYIALGWNIVAYYLCYDFDIKFRFLGWILDGWPIYYFAGYYYRHVVAGESKVKWTIIGIACFVGTALGMIYLHHFEGATDMQVMFTLYCVACFMFWDKAVKIKGDKVQKIILFLSSKTFLVYLFHMHGIEYAVRKLSIVDGSLVNGLLAVIGAFIISLIASIIANLCLKPIQKLLDKKN